MSDEKRWELVEPLEIESGIGLMEKLADIGVGEAVLAIGWAKFGKDEDGRVESDLDARKVAKAYFTSRYEGELTEAEKRKGVAGDAVHVCDHHKDMVKQLCETGKYVPALDTKATIAEKLKHVPRFTKPKAKAEKAEGKATAK